MLGYEAVEKKEKKEKNCNGDRVSGFSNNKSFVLQTCPRSKDTTMC